MATEAAFFSPQIKTPQIGRRYQSLPYWLARQRQMRELRGEELRLRYVAMTRARDTLILTGTVSAKQFESRWRQPGQVTPQAILSVNSYADWLGLWFAQNSTATDSASSEGELTDKVRLYRPQLKLYASALSRIYERPVTECWLRFLALPKSARVEL